MASYHFHADIISRGTGGSISCSIGYITGQNLRDDYLEEMNYHPPRQDVLFQKIFLPDGSPQEFYDIQKLCTAIDGAEKRYDARTGRSYICSLPNELGLEEHIRIVTEFVENNFVSRDLCAIAAIHEGINEEDPIWNNPHAHIIVNTRAVTVDGFHKYKARWMDKPGMMIPWRSSWADVVNHAYERNGLDIRVSHESFEVQGITDKEATIHLTRSDYEKEQRGIRTPAGDRKREIIQRNQERALAKQVKKERSLDRSLSR